jgi:hypothetical protein
MFRITVLTHQSNLQHLNVLVKHVSLAFQRLDDMTESIDCGDSRKDQLNSFLFAMDASKSCLVEKLREVLKSIKVIHNVTLKECQKSR